VLRIRCVVETNEPQYLRGQFPRSASSCMKFATNFRPNPLIEHAIYGNGGQTRKTQ